METVERRSWLNFYRLPETRPGALVEDRYAIAIQHDEETIEHVPKFLSKYTGILFLMEEGTRSKKDWNFLSNIAFDIRSKFT